jgi:hypothetical protein
MDTFCTIRTPHVDVAIAGGVTPANQYLTPFAGTAVPCNIVKLIMGNVFQHQEPTGEWVAYTSRKPKLDWTGLEDETAVLATPMMFCKMAGKDVKGYCRCITSLKTKLAEDGKLENFKWAMWKHF